MWKVISISVVVAFGASSLALPSDIVLRQVEQRIDSQNKAESFLGTFYEEITRNGVVSRRLGPSVGSGLSGLGFNPTQQTISDFVYLEGEKEGILAFSGPLNQFAQNSGVIYLAHLHFNNLAWHHVGEVRTWDAKYRDFASISLGQIAPTGEPTSIAIAIPTGASLFPKLVALAFRNQVVVFDVSTRPAKVISRIPGASTDLAFLDNERLAIVSPTGLSIVAASTGTVLSTVNVNGLKGIASHKGTTVLWGGSQVVTLEGNQLKSSSIPNQSVDSCSIVLGNIPVCATSGNGKTLWYYQSGQWASFWNNPNVANDDPWQIGIGDGLILPFLSTKPSSQRYYRLYSWDGVDIRPAWAQIRLLDNSKRPVEYNGPVLELVSLTGLVAKLNNATLPKTDFVPITLQDKEGCVRSRGSVTQESDWVLITGCDQIALVDFKDGSVVIQGTPGQVITNIIFQATGNRVAFNLSDVEVGLARNDKGQPLMVIQFRSFAGSSNPLCTGVFAFSGGKFTTVMTVNKDSRTGPCTWFGGPVRGYLSEQELTLMGRNALITYDRSGKQVDGFTYLGNNSVVTYQINNQEWWGATGRNVVITNILPSSNGVSLYGIFEQRSRDDWVYVYGSVEVNPLDGTFGPIRQVAPDAGVFPRITSNIGSLSRMYSFATVEGLATPDYITPEGHLIYLTKSGVVRIKLSNESLKQWVKQ